MYFIISEQMVIILHIEVIQSTLMCYCKRKMYSTVNLYSDDVVVDVITIRENRNFHLRLFLKGGSLHLEYSGILDIVRTSCHVIRTSCRKLPK
jgi:hypothetical protein